MKPFLRNTSRFLIAAGAAALALGYVPESSPWLVSVFPRLSPILSLFGAVAAREWLGWMMVLGVPVLVFSVFKARFFCRYVCPMGFVAETAGRLNPWGKGLIRYVPGINRPLLLVIGVTAACGYPLFIWCDPLCIFNGFFAALRTPFTIAAAATGTGFVLIAALSVVAPNVWCYRICPLGGLQDMLSRIRRPKPITETAAGKTSLTAVSATRRAVLAAIPAAVAGITAKRVFGKNGRKTLRPPGADIERINALCARCGNCMTVCPYRLIEPDLGESGIDGLFTPALRLRSVNINQEQYCFQDCVACTQVCPTGALRPLTVEQKHATPIGIAEIDLKKCLAWEKNEYCAVCDEYCPFKAVKLKKHGDVMCPIIDPALCRGCGACESACPADPIAIIVKPL